MYEKYFAPSNQSGNRWLSNYFISLYQKPRLRNQASLHTRFLNYALRFSFPGIEYHERVVGSVGVHYQSVIQAPDGRVKTEIRLFYVWDNDMQRPKLVTNLARLSRGDMIGVKYNKDKTWVGGTVAFFEQ